jgi:hypothetical protein
LAFLLEFPRDIARVDSPHTKAEKEQVGEDQDTTCPQVVEDVKTFFDGLHDYL